ncbi:hypothetical protein [Dankookia sp. P2]|uniref:hypothetical protein n=1 Tax=Dankookia sp. P2 TaxID=3423955 RepID=UPI003D66ADF7
MSALFKLQPQLEVELLAVGRYGDYQNSGFRPLVADYSGAEWTASLAARYVPWPGLLVEGSVYYYGADARADYYARSGPGALLAVSKDLRVGDYRFGATLRGGLRHLSYNAPDPFIDPTRTRSDTFFNAGAVVTLPLSRDVSAIVQYNYLRNRSDYAVYSFTDHSVTAGLRLAF